MHRRRFIATMFALPLPVLAACAASQPQDAATTPGSTTSAQPSSATATQSQGPTAIQAATTTRPAGWAEATHGGDAAPNYAVVFPQDQVSQLTITIAPDQWEAMQADMVALLGERGTREQGGGMPGGPGTGGQPPGGAGQPPPANGQAPGGAPGRPGMGGDFTPQNPIWVPATISFAGGTWTNVGVRYKGNSSLRSSWGSGSLKLPLKLDFDQFEGDHPQIENQRFYGFKQLSLANGFGDSTYLRESTTYNLLEAAGLVAAETAAYEILLDYGQGVERLGLYTMVEVIDDTVIARTFGDDSGNIYEADGAAASLAAGTAGQIATSFQKENNDAEADWSDITALYELLHSAKRTSDPAVWRSGLESIFEVDAFLKWLALSAVIQHWDTYGSMTHNYYLYHNPGTGRLTWISWDHNFVLGGSGGPGGRGRGSSALDKSDVGEGWPLIRFLLDDETYYARYIAAMREVTSTVFDPQKLAEQYQQRATLLRPYVIQEQDAESFDAAVEALTAQTSERARLAAEFLAAQPQT